MLARAMLDAGHTETEIGLAIGVSVNNIIHWRREEGLAAPQPTQVTLTAPHEREAPLALDQSRIMSTAPRRQIRG
jgi:hypothetical protein